MLSVQLTLLNTGNGNVNGTEVIASGKFRRITAIAI
jgi:hypothetical protein